MSLFLCAQHFFFDVLFGNTATSLSVLGDVGIGFHPRLPQKLVSTFESKTQCQEDFWRFRKNGNFPMNMGKLEKLETLEALLLWLFF